MSLWSNFTDFLKGVGGAFSSLPKGLIGTVAQSGAQIGATQMSKTDPIAAAIAGVGAATKTQKSLEKAGITTNDKGTVKIIDPVLKVAAKADEYVFSPLIKRPLGTGFLITDPDSPLYKSDKFGKGFQFSDVAEAYNRTGNVFETIAGEDYLVRPGVTLGQAFPKSWIAGLTPIGQIERWALSDIGGIDLEEVDLWDDQNIQKNFVDNPVGRFISGANDFIIGEAAINLAFGGAGALTKALTRAVGLNTKFRASDFDATVDFKNKVDDHLRYRATNGTEGTFYNVGEDVEKMAQSTNFIEVYNIAKKYTFNKQAIDEITKTTDPSLVLDYILMDKGNFGAYQRLVESGNADAAWSISKAGDEVLNDYITNGKVREYTPEQRARWMQAHDDAIRKDPQLQRIFDTFFEATYDDAGKMVNANPKFLSTNYKPMEPVIGREFLGTIRSKADQAKANIIQRDFSNAGGIAKTVLSSKVGGPVTVLMRTVGTYMPNGFVSHSTLRPMQGVQELISVFDDVPLFTKGNKVITTRGGDRMTVSQYRDAILKDYVGLKSDGDKANFVDRLNEDLTYTIAYSRGFFDDQLIDSFVQSLKGDIYGVHGQLTNYGYAMTPNGVRVSTDAKTLQMLANSTPMLPFGKLDSMIRRAQRGGAVGGAVNVADFTRSGVQQIFELGNKAFSFAQLYRFSYVPKNSIFEPMLAGFLAEGTGFAAQAAASLTGRTVNTFTNFLGKNYVKAKSALPGNAINAVTKELKDLNKQLSEAIAYRDQRYAEYHKYFVNKDGVSPATKGEYADEIIEELRGAENIIAKIESDLNVYTIETFSKNVKDLLEVPSIYTLRSRIETLKKAGAVRYGSEIRTAEIALGKAVSEMNSLAPDLIKIDKTIETAYKNIGSLLDEIKPQLKKEAELFSVAENKYTKKPKPPKTKRFLTADNQVIEFPAFGDRNFFGEGYYSEISNTSDRTVEILGNKFAVGRLKNLVRNNPSKITKPTDPDFFGELEFVVNYRLRGDVLADKVLAGADRATLLAWGKTAEGRSYAIAMNKEPDDIVDIIDDSIRYVNSLLPTMESKALALKGPVNQFELQKALADKVDQLTPIQPLDVEYTSPGAIASFNQGIDAVLARPWRYLLKPENIIRQVYGDVAHAKIVTEKARALEAAGQKVTLETLLALRQSSAIEIVDNLKKVFYTIPRQHRALYLSRLAIVFPNAAFSGFYRYTGFAARQPRRVAGFLNAYYSLYNTFGVDQYGNPVENPEDAEYLLVPGSKELGFNEGKGIILSNRATNFLANLPGPNWFIPVPIAQVYADKPNAEKTIKKMVDKYLGGIPGFSYDELFPYGIQPTQDQIKSSFTPSWLRDAYTAFSADEENIRWREALENEAQRLNIMAGMNLRKPPTYKEIVEGAKSLYYRRAFNKFFSIFGTSQVLGQYGTGLFEDYYQMLMEINTAKAEAIQDPVERNKALARVYDETEKQFQAQVRVSDKVAFPMDRLFVDVRDKAAYFPSSIDAYERIYENYSGLAKYLEDKVAPETVGLLAADLPYDYSGQIAKFLNDPNATLPGGTKLNSQIKTRNQVENELELSRFWGAYTAKIKELNEAARKAGYASYASIEGLRIIKDDFVNNTLGKASPLWLNEYKKNANNGDKAYTWAKAIKVITRDKKEGVPNKFMKEFGDSQFWVHAKAFSDLRDMYTKAYKDMPSGNKNVIQKLWLNRIEGTLDLWDPTLQKIITRYFLNDDLEAIE